MELVEKDTGARVDSTTNVDQTLHISGHEEAVKKMVMVLQSLPGGGIDQSRQSLCSAEAIALRKKHNRVQQTGC